MPTYLEKAVFVLETQGYDVVSTSIHAFGNDNNIYGVDRFPALAELLQGNHVPGCAVYRRDLWELSGGYRDTGLGRDYIYEDWRMWVRLAALGARFANLVGEPLFRYRVHSPTSLSNQCGTTPPIEVHREAVRTLNGDLIDEAALRRSAQARSTEFTILDPLVNLTSRRQQARPAPTILLAFPFLIAGGAERLLSQIATHLHASGYRVVIVTTLATPSEFGDATSLFATATSEIYHLPRFLDASSWRDFLHYLIESRDVALCGTWAASSSTNTCPTSRPRFLTSR